MSLDPLRRQVALELDRAVIDLERLVRIPSISQPDHDPAALRDSAWLTADILANAGVEDVDLVEFEDGHPAVLGTIEGPPLAPTVLLYAHHDVQPAGPADGWLSPPFEPATRDGRMYGRGTADDKAGIVMHAAALRALRSAHPGGIPVSVRILVEGEEEASTAHLPELFLSQADRLRSDVAVIGDGDNVSTGVPTLGVSLRGLIDCHVAVRVLATPRHSGEFGGPLPDALTALCRIIATLHDEAGDVAVAGLHAFEWPGEPVAEAEFRRQAGVVDSLPLVGTGRLSDRLFTKPAAAVVGLDAPSVRDASNQLVAAAAAKVSLRLAPGDDPDRALGVVTDHLRAAAPWGVQVDVTKGEAGSGFIADTSSTAYRAARAALSAAFDRPVVERGAGGSIPVVAQLTQTFPDLEVLILGPGDDRSNPHSVDESVELAELERMILAEALLLRNLAVA